MTLTVASYNIHKCAGLDRRVDLDRIAQVLEEIDADLVGLQEVFRPQALGLAERLGMQVAMGPTRERDGLPYGNAVLTRLAIRGRSEERRVGKECSSPCRSRWSPYH